jgi:pSer/pThr/pTyr-binding forkhead associated (FHA) protein
MNLFWQACGMTAPLELQVSSCSGEVVVEVCFLEQPFAIVGRDEDNQVCLPGSQVSRRHAYLQVFDGEVFFVDLGSRRGSFRNGAPFPKGWFLPDAPIRIDPFILGPVPGPDCGPLLEGDVQVPLPTERWPADHVPVPGVTLEINHEGRWLRWKVNRRLTLVGAQPPCTVRLPALGISHFHCSLIHTQLGLWVVDLRSRRGTRLNGKRISWAQLRDGDILEVGPVKLRAWYEEPAEDEEDVAAPTEETVATSDNGHVHTHSPDQHTTQLVPAGNGELLAPSHTLLRSVMDQFQVMQDDTFDQFRQLILIVVQAFSSLHREKSNEVLTQLEELSRLTEEVRALQAQLLQASAAPAAPEEAPTSEPVIVAAPEIAHGPHLNGAHAPKDHNGAQAAPDLNGAQGQHDPPPDAVSPSPQAEEGTAATTDAPAVPVGEGIHAWLQQRIEMLNARRKGRWQKLLDLVFRR